jgi:hypothetical protein
MSYRGSIIEISIWFSRNINTVGYRGLNVTSDSRDVIDSCAILGNYAASSVNVLPTFRTTYRFHIQGPRILLDSLAFSFILPVRDNL